MIEGLNNLINLKDLSLAHNHIKGLENMDSLPLQVLSIGNNLIDRLDQLSYLRTFSQLKAVSLAGNPVADDTNYQSFVLAHLPALVYFDYRLVTDEAVSSASCCVCVYIPCIVKLLCYSEVKLSHSIRIPLRDWNYRKGVQKGRQLNNKYKMKRKHYIKSVTSIEELTCYMSIR